jgi:hypothetical protein
LRGAVRIARMHDARYFGLNDGTFIEILRPSAA